LSARRGNARAPGPRPRSRAPATRPSRSPSPSSVSRAAVNVRAAGIEREGPRAAHLREIEQLGDLGPTCAVSASTLARPQSTRFERLADGAPSPVHAPSRACRRRQRHGRRDGRRDRRPSASSAARLASRRRSHRHHDDLAAVLVPELDRAQHARTSNELTSSRTPSR
jgi:hypothetical protein